MSARNITSLIAAAACVISTSTMTGTTIAADAPAGAGASAARVWTAEACRSKPIAFVDYAISQVRSDIEKKQVAEEELASRIGEVSAKCRELAKLRVEAYEQACQFRACIDQGTFPLNLGDRCYADSESVREQVSLLLAEVDGYDRTGRDLKQSRRSAVRDRETLVVEINNLDARLVQLATKRARYQVVAVRGQSRELLKLVNGLIPVYGPKTTTHEQHVETFLSGLSEPCPLGKSASERAAATRQSTRKTNAAKKRSAALPASPKVAQQTLSVQQF